MTTLNDALVAIIQKTQGAVESGVAFLSGQMPDVIQQLLLWKFTEALVWFVVMTLFQVVLIWGAFKAHKISEDTNDYVPFVPYMIFGGLVSLLVTGFAVGSAFTALKVYIAPKVWLLEYAASLVK